MQNHGYLEQNSHIRGEKGESLLEVLLELRVVLCSICYILVTGLC